MGIVDLDHVDEGLQIGLAEWNRSGGDVLPHGATELLKQCGVDPDGLRRMRFGALERRLGAVPIGLQGVQAILEDVVHFGHAVLDQPIEPLELVVGVGDLALQSDDTGIDSVCLFRAP
ncbi:hypothetical protein [Afipia felis]|uniref:hypothetical protein n=1 Tax=Afipia felis TaxID=1035 RepID=UPI001FCD2FA6|nr:hypothetical protein [Afipia felis]